MPNSADRSVWTRRIIALVILAAAGLFLATNLSTATDTVAAAGAIAVWPMVAGVALSAFAVVNRGMMHRRGHQMVGMDVTTRQMVVTSSVGFAANKIIKSGGASGLAVFVRHGRRTSLDTAAVATACALVSVASLLAFSATVGLSTAMLAATGHLSTWWIAVAGWAAVQAVLVFVLFTIGLRGDSALERLWHHASCGRSWCSRRRLLWRWAKPRPGEQSSSSGALVNAIHTARANRSLLSSIFGHACLSKLLGGLMLAAAVQAIGLALSPSEVVSVYALALAASSLSLAPGGIGVVEASTAALLISNGASAADAAIAVSLFRVFDLWLPVAVGAILGRHELRLGGRVAIPVSLATPILAIPAGVPSA